MLFTRGKEFICECYFSRNIFLPKYNLHVSFEDQESFEKEYRQTLRMKGCSSDQQFKSVISQISEERSRRKQVHKNVAERSAYFKQAYQPIHPDIWVLKPEHLDNRFLKIVNTSDSKKLVQTISVVSENEGTSSSMEVYQFPMLSEKMCKLLVEELDAFENCPGLKSRPNTMNKYGVSLDEMGISEGLIVPLLCKYLTPICSVLFPHWGGSNLDSFKAFTVNYELGKDLELAQHYDNAEISINISLTDGFEGGDLHFGEMKINDMIELPSTSKRLSHLYETESDEDEEHFKQPNQLTMNHKLGWCILHCGRRLHRAAPLTRGSRTNLIVWMRSSTVRNQLCPMCGAPPSLVQVEAAGEGFTMVDVCSCS